MQLANNEAIIQFRHLHRVAIELKEKFDQNAHIDALVALEEVYSRELERLGRLIPSEVFQQGYLLRHSSFLKRYIFSGQPQNCEGDIRSICLTDIFEVEESYLHYLSETKESRSTELDWSMIHPKIHELAKPRFDQGLYSDAIVAAFKELNSQIKDEYKTISNKELDGEKLMRHAFSVSNKNGNNPTIQICQTDTESGLNKQDGYMNIFAGVMRGVRNPLSHANVNMNLIEAWELLVFSSHLMRIWDNRIKKK
ncbi:MAG: TIGR02391 family protein [Cyclobacteriaceae bacterium]